MTPIEPLNPLPSSHPLRQLHRRQFGLLLPLGGLALLAACSDKAPPAAAPISGGPAADAAPAPAAMPAPAPAPTSSPAAATSSADLPMVDPADPAAAALHYTADASQVVAATNPTHQPGQACANCALYAGQPGAAAGPCPLYVGHQVSAKAWCSAYTKKAG